MQHVAPGQKEVLSSYFLCYPTNEWLQNGTNLSASGTRVIS